MFNTSVGSPSGPSVKANFSISLSVDCELGRVHRNDYIDYSVCRNVSKHPYFGRIIFIFPLVKKAAFLIKRYFVASMGAKVEVLAHPGDKYCEDRQAG